jgi:capsular polysaccharide biosynthesis protein
MVHTLLKHSRLIFLCGLSFALIAFLVSLILPKYWSAESQVLLISKGYGGVDPYTQAKAAEQIGGNLAQVIGTSDFYNKVIESQTMSFDRERWAVMSERNRRKNWTRDVQAEVVYGTGLLRLTVYSQSKDDTIALSKAVTDTLASRGWEYVGGDVGMKVVNNPLLSRLPARPNFIVNTILGFVLGVLLSAWWVAKNRHGVFGRI